MKKNGFTLIELLSVIVILAIIALIAVPIVLSIIDDTKESSILRSGEFFVDAIEKSIMKESMSTGNSLNYSECVLVSKDKVKCDGKEIPIEINGELPSKGSLVNFKYGKVYRVILYYDNKIVIKNSDSEFFIGDINDIAGTHIALLESQIKDAYGKDIKLGDYVNYDETKGGTVTVGKDVKWRVLGIENGNLLLVSATNVGDNNYINGADDYLTYVKKQCEPYAQGKYAVDSRSITVEDINKITGYNPMRKGNGKIFHQGYITQYGNEVIHRLEKDANGNTILKWESAVNPKSENGSIEYNNSTFTLPDGTKLAFDDNKENKEKKEITIKNDYYWYIPQTLTRKADDPIVGVSEETPAYDMLFSNTDYGIGEYWLASEYSQSDGDSGVFGLRSVSKEKVGYGSWLWYSDKGSDKFAKGCRAVVALKSDIELTKTNENTWKIKNKNAEQEKEELCVLLSGTAKTKGSKYSCEVKEDTRYNFYVLSTNNDGTTNLIMEQNINSDGTPAGMTGVTQATNASQYNLVAWNNESGQSTNAYGPVTAMNFLYNATKDWINIDPVNYTYNDRKIQGATAENTSYISFVSTNGVAVITQFTGNTITIGTSDEPLRARMPIGSSDANITEITIKSNAPYLYTYLDSAGNVAPYGYWTLSSNGGDSNRARRVYATGIVNTGTVYSANYQGVRPVITLKI